MTRTDTPNVDPSETARFAALASTWWDPHGASRPLHLINPLRLQYVQRMVTLEGREVLDVGCGAGLLSEAMALTGANVCAIDAGSEVLEVARLHALESGLTIDYVESTAEQWAREHRARYDVVTCMELIEHVPEPRSLVQACADACRPGGHVFFSTINRTPKAWLLAIFAAEYALGLLPRATHDYQRLVRPSELDEWARASGLTMQAIDGMLFNPVSEQFRLARDVSVNYIAHFRRDGELI